MRMPPIIGGHPLSGLFVIVRTHDFRFRFLRDGYGNESSKEKDYDSSTISEKFRPNGGHQSNDDGKQESDVVFHDFQF